MMPSDCARRLATLQIGADAGGARGYAVLWGDDDPVVLKLAAPPVFQAPASDDGRVFVDAHLRPEGVRALRDALTEALAKQPPPANASSAPSATEAPLPAFAEENVHLVFDPAAGTWLVVRREWSVAGMPLWKVVATYASRAHAELQSGWHDAPVCHWLVHDPAMGWYRGPGTWVHRHDRAGLLAQEQAAALLAEGGGRTAFVIRADGRTTCPDITA